MDENIKKIKQLLELFPESQDKKIIIETIIMVANSIRKKGTMKERPIFFNTPMVKAILNGRKTQTRRIIKPQPPDDRYSLLTLLSTTGDSKNVDKYHWGIVKKLKIIDDQEKYFKCPYGNIGDLLYVRERFCYGAIVAGDSIPKQNDPIYISQCEGENNFIPYEYAISDHIGIEDVSWRPSIHMPKEYARIWLKIIDIRVERLQDISEEDAKSEGKLPDKETKSYVDSLRISWDKIYPKIGYGWEHDPFVWAVEFKIFDKNKS